MRAIEETAVEQAVERVRQTISVFLAGPQIDTKQQPQDIAGEEPLPSARRLRLSLFHQIKEEYKVPPTLGEHRELIENGKRHFGDASNLAAIELDAIHKTHDCVIIIPSSPGSFCEFGLFSGYESICEKMLVLLDERFTGNPGYLHLGPATLAQIWNSKIESIDYNNLNEAWRIVNAYIRSTGEKKLLRSTFKRK